MLPILMLAVAIDDHAKINLRDLEEGATISCGAFDRTGERLALGLSNGTVLVGDLATGKIVARKEIIKGAEIAAIAFGNKSDSIAVGLTDHAVVGLGQKGLQSSDALYEITIYELKKIALEFTEIGRFARGHECSVAALLFDKEDDRISAFLRMRGGNWIGELKCKGPLAVFDIRAKQLAWFDSVNQIYICSKAASIGGKTVAAVAEITNPNHKLAEERVSGISLLDLRTGAKTRVGEAKGEIDSLAVGERTVFGIAVELVTPDFNPRYSFVRWPLAGDTSMERTPLDEPVGQAVTSSRCIAARSKDGRIVLWSGETDAKPKITEPGSSTATVLCVSNQGRVALKDQGRTIVVVTPK